MEWSLVEEGALCVQAVVVYERLTNRTNVHTPPRHQHPNSSAGYIFYGRGPLVRDSLGQVVPGCERNVCDNGGWDWGLCIVGLRAVCL